ncbi:hypothetical protein SDC49_02540 [Lactobacillus sp. R2/2]|nr:hypothetical protein [Lactobacillus sp. R2/2]
MTVAQAVERRAAEYSKTKDLVLAASMNSIIAAIGHINHTATALLPHLSVVIPKSGVMKIWVALTRVIIKPQQ